MDYLIMLSFAQLIYTFLLSIVFFSKERINKKESRKFTGKTGCIDTVSTAGSGSVQSYALPLYEGAVWTDFGRLF